MLDGQYRGDTKEGPSFLLLIKWQISPIIKHYVWVWAPEPEYWASQAYPSFQANFEQVI